MTETPQDTPPAPDEATSSSEVAPDEAAPTVSPADVPAMARSHADEFQLLFLRERTEFTNYRRRIEEGRARDEAVRLLGDERAERVGGGLDLIQRHAAGRARGADRGSAVSR